MNKERIYRSWHSALCMVVVILGNVIIFLAGAGDLHMIAQLCVWVAISLQWYVLIKGTKQDKIEKISREIEEFAGLVGAPISFRHYTYLHPVARRWYYRWYDKWKGITYVHLWSYSFDLDDKAHEFESEIRFPITGKQLFEMKLKGYTDMCEPTDVIPVLEYIGDELCGRILAGPTEDS